MQTRLTHCMTLLRQLTDNHIIKEKMGVGGEESSHSGSSYSKNSRYGLPRWSSG